MIELPKIDTKKNNILFYIALVIELAMMIIEKSELPFGYESYVFRVTFLLTLITVLLTKHSKKEWGVIGFVWLLCTISYLVTGKNDLLRFATFVMAARDINLKKSIELSFYFTLVGTIAIALLSVFGILGDVYLVADYGRVAGEELRYVFGFGHPNTLFGVIYALVLMWIWLYGSKGKILSYVVLVAVSAFACVVTASRTGAVILFMTLTMTILFRSFPTLFNKLYVYVLSCIISPILCVAVSVWASWATSTIYTENGVSSAKWYWDIEELITFRMSNLYYSSYEHGAIITNWKLFADRNAESFFDMGWVRLYYWYGIIPATIIVLLIILFVYLCWKNKDIWSLVLVVSLGVYTIIEATYVSRYIGRSFFLLIFASYLGRALKEWEA